MTYLKPRLFGKIFSKGLDGQRFYGHNMAKLLNEMAADGWITLQRGFGRTKWIAVASVFTNESN